MIITVEELRQYINTDEGDQALEARLQALEILIRKYTNNNFMDRYRRRDADIVGGLFLVEALSPFSDGDTIQVSGSILNNGLYTVTGAEDSSFKVKESTQDEMDVQVTLIKYPEDVKMGVVNLMKWEMNQREKVGVQSESLSRHTVQYYDMSKDNTEMSYPVSLMGFLKPYCRARFGQGVDV